MNKVHEPVKKIPSEPEKHAQDNPPKQGVNDSKEGQQRQGIGTPNEHKDKHKEHQNR